MTPEQLNRLIELENRLARLEKSDRYTFGKDIEMEDGRKVKLSGATGTKIGTESTQKLSLWGVTPVNQPETVSDPSVSTVSDNSETTNNTTINSNFSNIETAVNTIIDRLEEVGIIKT